jgi:hypothetical protein
MEPIIQVQAHIGADGTLRIEGLHHIADQDVVVMLATKPRPRAEADLPFDLEQYAAPVMGKTVADKLKAISQACSSLPVLDDRSADDILGYNDIGLPE